MTAIDVPGGCDDRRYQKLQTGPEGPEQQNHRGRRQTTNRKEHAEWLFRLSVQVKNQIAEMATDDVDPDTE
jgi:hypothetical protein